MNEKNRIEQFNRIMVNAYFFSMTGCAPLSVVDFVDGEVTNDSELYVAPGKCYTVPIVISLPGTTLQWEFTTQPKVNLIELN